MWMRGKEINEEEEDVGDIMYKLDLMLQKINGDPFISFHLLYFLPNYGRLFINHYVWLSTVVAFAGYLTSFFHF